MTGPASSLAKFRWLSKCIAWGGALAFGALSAQADYTANLFSGTAANDFQFAAFAQHGVAGGDGNSWITWNGSAGAVSLSGRYQRVVTRFLIKSDDGSGLNDGAYTGSVFASISYNYSSGSNTSNSVAEVALAAKQLNAANNYPLYFAQVSTNRLNLFRWNAYNSYSIVASATLPQTLFGRYFTLQLRSSHAGSSQVNLAASLRQYDAEIASVSYSDAAGYRKGYIGFGAGENLNSGSIREINVSDFRVNTEPSPINSTSIDGTYSPGGAGSIGADQMDGNVVFGNTAQFQVDLSPSGYDSLAATGLATLGGTLEVVNAEANLLRLNSYTILTADSITGRFAATNLPALPEGQSWLVSYSSSNVVLTVQDLSTFVVERFIYSKTDDQAFNAGSTMGGGAGFSTNLWDGTVLFKTAGLTHSGIRVAGGNASVGANLASYRYLPLYYGTNNIGENASTSIWMSVVMERTSGAADSYSGLSLFDGTNERLFFGKRNLAAYWGVEAKVTPTVSANSLIPLSSPVLMVTRMDFTRTNMAAYSWFFDGAPVYDEASLPAPDVTATSGPFQFNRFRLQSGSAAPTINYDEITVGSTFKSVVEHIPEIVITGLYSPGGAGAIGTTNETPVKVTFASDATLQIDVGASSQDTLTLDGLLEAGGALSVQKNGSDWSFAAWNTYTILTARAVSGQFASTNLPTLPAGLLWKVFYESARITAIVYPQSLAGAKSVYWSGGYTDRADGTLLPDDTNLLKGVWNLTTKNWATDYIGTTYIPYHLADSPFVFMHQPTNSTGDVFLNLANDVSISGLLIPLQSPSGGSSYYWTNNSSARVITLTGTNVNFFIETEPGGANSLILATNMLLAGSAPLTKLGAGKLDIRSMSTNFTGALTIKSGKVQFEKIDSPPVGGAIGSTNIVLRGEAPRHRTLAAMHDYPNPELVVVVPKGGQLDAIADKAAITLSRGTLNYTSTRSDTESLASSETIGKIIIENQAFFSDATPRANGLYAGKLILSDAVIGLDRGTSGHGTLFINGNLTTDVVVANGWATGTLLPWLAGMNGTLHRLNTTSKAIERIPQTAAPANLSSWIAGNDYRVGNRDAFTPSGSIGSVSINSLGTYMSASATLTIGGGNTLTIASGAINDYRYDNGTTTLTGGSLTSGTGELYIHVGHAAGKGIIFRVESAITGSGMDLIKAGLSRLTYGGTSDNTYSGVTYVNAGDLELAKSSGTSVSGPLVVHRGASVHVNGSVNQISANSPVTIEEGAKMSVYNNLVLNSVLTLNGGDFLVREKMFPVVTNAATGLAFNGGRISRAGEAQNGDGSTFSLQANVSYAATSTQQAIWHSYVVDNRFWQGVTNFLVDLDGGNRIFNIAKSTFLPVNVPEMDFYVPIVPGAPAGGAITKTGSGTLRFTAGNSYSGGTTISQGVLHVAHYYAPAFTGLLGSINENSSVQMFMQNNIITFHAPVATNFLIGQPVTGTGITSNNFIQEIMDAYRIQVNYPNTRGERSDIEVGEISRKGSLGSGPVTVSGGALLVDPGITLDSGNHLTIQGGTVTNNGTWPATITINSGTLTGSGTNTGAAVINGGLVLANLAGGATINGSIAPAGTATGTLSVSGNVTWNGGDTFGSAHDWYFDLGPNSTSDLLKITGDFSKGLGSAFRFDFLGNTNAGTYALVKWSGAITGFSADDFSFVNLGPNLSAKFEVDELAGQLKVSIEPCASPPVFTLGSGPDVCSLPSPASTSIAHTLLAGNPTRYSVDFDDTANAAGFADRINIAYSSAPLPFTIPGSISAGIYTGQVVMSDADGCYASTAFTVTIRATPEKPGAIHQGDGASSICYGSAGVSYSVTPVTWATGYTWTVFSPATLISGQGTTNIVVNWNTSAAGEAVLEVKAVNACGESETTMTLFNIITSEPNAPTLGESSEISLTRFTINWSAPAPILNAAVGGYQLDVSTASDFSHDFVASNVNVSAASTSYTLESLDPGQTYFFRVRAYNACGASAYSETGKLLTPQTLAAWDVSLLSGYGSSPQPPSASAGSLVVTGLTRAAALNTGGSPINQSWGATGWSTANNLNSAVADGSYFTFSLSPAAGTELSIYDIALLDYYRTASGPTNVIIQYSLDGVSFSDFFTNSYPAANQGASLEGIPHVVTNIPALRAIHSGNTLTFRVVNFSASGADGAWGIYNTQANTNYDFEIRGNICSNPAVVNVTGGGSYCSGGSGREVGLDGSTRGVTYYLYRDGVALVASKAGTGSALNFGSMTTAGEYTVAAVRDAGECDSQMSGSVTVSITVPPAMPSTTIGEGEEAVQVSPITVVQTNDDSVVMNWTAPAGFVSGYNVKRRASFEASFTTIGSAILVTNFTDSTALAGNTYYYRVSALDDPCEGADSLEVDVVMPAFCPTGFPPRISNPGNKTLTIGNVVNFSVQAEEVSDGCQAPAISESSLPSGMTAGDLVVGRIRTRSYQWTPVGGQQGAYPITVTATDEENLTSNVTFVIYVGNFGESGNGGSTPPPSLSTWNVGITNVEKKTDSQYNMVWATSPGVSYDIYSAASFPGGTWTKIYADQITFNTSNICVVAHDSTRTYLQAVPSGMTPGTNGVWGIFTPTIPVSFSMQAPPNKTDRLFNGELGASLAAALPTGTLLYILQTAEDAPDESSAWITLELNGDGQWIDRDLGSLYTTPLAAGQGFWVSRPGGSTAPLFAGPIGPIGANSTTLNPGFNIISVAEGYQRAASSAFESAEPVGSYDENAADQVIILSQDGAWRRLIRRPNRTWKDTGATNPNDRGNTTYQFIPGDAYYYLRRGSGTTLSF